MISNRTNATKPVFPNHPSVPDLHNLCMSLDGILACPICGLEVVFFLQLQKANFRIFKE